MICQIKVDVYVESRYRVFMNTTQKNEAHESFGLSIDEQLQHKREFRNAVACMVGGRLSPGEGRRVDTAWEQGLSVEDAAALVDGR